MVKTEEFNIAAEELAKEHKEISIAEFFEKNRHLLGFDSKIKAMLTCVKEAVDNSLDACESMAYLSMRRKQKYELPEINVKIKKLGEDLYRIIVRDNGPGILKEQIPKMFGKFLYGSKFHKMIQSRGQQGIGIHSCVLYSQLTTGKPTRIISRIAPDKPANYVDIMINTVKNEPEIIDSGVIERFPEKHGTQVEFTIEARYLGKGEKSVYEYLQRTAIVNPYAKIIFIAPDKQKFVFNRTIKSLPKEAKEIKPHPYGIELGILVRMLRTSKAKTLTKFVTSEFCRIGATIAKRILKTAKLDPNMEPHSLSREEASRLLKAMQKTKLPRPPTDCLSPIGADALEKSIRALGAEFVATISREPSVYRGMPFQIEAAIAWSSQFPKDSYVKILRYANKIPLQYDAGACAMTAAVAGTDWRRYGLSQSSGSGIPVGPAIILLHMASVWIPYTSEGKAAIASYPEIIREMKLALQDCGRKLGRFLAGRRREHEAQRKRSLFEKYIPEAANTISILSGESKSKIEKGLFKILNKRSIVPSEVENAEEESSKENSKKNKKRSN